MDTHPGGQTNSKNDSVCHPHIPVVRAILIPLLIAYEGKKVKVLLTIWHLCRFMHFFVEALIRILIFPLLQVITMVAWIYPLPGGEVQARVFEKQF